MNILRKHIEKRLSSSVIIERDTILSLLIFKTKEERINFMQDVQSKKSYQEGKQELIRVRKLVKEDLKQKRMNRTRHTFLMKHKSDYINSFELLVSNEERYRKLRSEANYILSKIKKDKYNLDQAVQSVSYRKSDGNPDFERFLREAINRIVDTIKEHFYSISFRGIHQAYDNSKCFVYHKYVVLN